MRVIWKDTSEAKRPNTKLLQLLQWRCEIRGFITPPATLEYYANYDHPSLDSVLFSSLPVCFVRTLYVTSARDAR